MLSLNKLIVLAACFGAGVAFTASTKTAYARICFSDTEWELGSVTIDGDGDLSVETTFWPDTATLSSGGELRVGESSALRLR